MEYSHVSPIRQLAGWRTTVCCIAQNELYRLETFAPEKLFQAAMRTPWSLRSVRISKAARERVTKVFAGRPGRSRVNSADASLLLRQVFDLSLIHISEPTRPY